MFSVNLYFFPEPVIIIDVMCNYSQNKSWHKKSYKITGSSDIPVQITQGHTILR